jgi:hypothetical protein
LRLLQQNRATLRELQHKQERLMGQALQLQQDMHDFR